MPRLRPYVVCGGGWVGGEEGRGEGRGGEGVGRGEDTDTDDDMDDMAGLRLRGNEHLSFISNQSEFYNVRVQCRSQQHHYRSHPPLQVLRAMSKSRALAQGLSSLHACRNSTELRSLGKLSNFQQDSPLTLSGLVSRFQQNGILHEDCRPRSRNSQFHTHPLRDVIWLRCVDFSASLASRISSSTPAITHANPATNFHDLVIVPDRLRCSFDRTSRDLLGDATRGCHHQGRELNAFGQSQPSSGIKAPSLSSPRYFVVRSLTLSTIPTFFSESRSDWTASSIQSHRTSRCRTRPDPIRLCMPMFAVLSARTSRLSSRPDSASTCTTLPLHWKSQRRWPTCEATVEMHHQHAMRKPTPINDHAQHRCDSFRGTALT